MSRRKQAKLKKYLLIPDTHIPYHDKRAWDLMLRVAKDFKPDGVIILGDFCDFYSVSSHSKDPSRRFKLDWELKEVAKALKQVNQLGAKNKIFIEGNHEDRLTRYLMDVAPELHDAVNVKSILKLSEQGWKHIPYKDDYCLGKLNFTHDVGTAGRYSVFKCLDTYQHSVITGHTHRLAYAVEGNAKGEYKLSAQFGWLGDVNEINYMHKVKAKKDWALGFGVMYFEETTGRGYVTPIPIVSYTVCFNGKLYK